MHHAPLGALAADLVCARGLTVDEDKRARGAGRLFPSRHIVPFLLIGLDARDRLECGAAASGADEPRMHARGLVRSRQEGLACQRRKSSHGETTHQTSVLRRALLQGDPGADGAWWICVQERRVVVCGDYLTQLLRLIPVPGRKTTRPCRRSWAACR